MDFDLNRLRVGWGEITAEEVTGLRILNDERERWRSEETKRIERERR